MVYCLFFVLMRRRPPRSTRTDTLFPYTTLFRSVLEGKRKILWIAATNPAQSMPDQAKVRAALQKAELVIVQEAFANTETLAYADLILPAATWPEKDGTVPNSERRISRVRADRKSVG